MRTGRLIGSLGIAALFPSIVVAVADLPRQLTVLTPSPLVGQEEPVPEARPTRPSKGCTLIMEPTGETESVSLRIGEGTDAYVTHVWGGMRWTCGTATMTADSAVRYDLERRIEMFGSVRYRDTIRTMDSRRLDFYEDDDRMIATGDVVLTRISSGSTLRGPRVTFLRAVSGIAERTAASGRPHMLLLPERGREGKPVDIDADSVDLAGESVAWAWGDVVIRRPDIEAEADSALFDMEAGRGVLYGSARARREGLEMEGDSLLLRFSEDELEEVRALGSGHALGDRFEVVAEEIKARLVANELDHVWAFGAGRSLAASEPYVLAADSIHFATTAGRLDTIVAVGQSAAVEIEEPDLSAGEPARGTNGGNWVSGDTIVVVFEGPSGDPAAGRKEDSDDAPAEPPEEAPAEPPEADQVIERLLAVGDARSFYTMVRDSTGAGAPSRNYLIGARIRVEFREGRAQRVMADRAIGIFLEPASPGDRPPAQESKPQQDSKRNGGEDTP
ncbi:MAG: hypothetical protein V3T97_01445 [Gemmatimonadota bacterium]